MDSKARPDAGSSALIKRAPLGNKHTFQTTKHSKRYWQDRVYKPEITRADGARDQSPNFAVRLSHAGRSMRLSLGTPNGAAAADLAREMFVFLTMNRNRFT
jgi:hypothetical protein